ncbi:RNA-binding protein 8A [Choanephora cucurbitarum]|uniref:RNA-binding protein 8A n=1 Tax=Choanephora cucurbitarum TaxID=101091 RepID=A0A1C7NFP2_9FUNG|nr:RNA-binding protein 8A [Choanephora cucurbitarum]
MSRSPERMNVDDEVRIRGRGFTGGDSRRGTHDELEPVRCNHCLTTICLQAIEGWIVIVRGLHEETEEEALAERFMEYGTIKNIHLNLDRRTGYVKGYALIEYEARKEAEAAIMEGNDSKFLGETIKVDYAFIKGPSQTDSRDSRDRRDRRRDRSASPGRD